MPISFKLSNINLFNDNSESNEVNNNGNGNGNSNINLPNSQITLSLSEQGFKYAESYNEIYEYLKESSDDLILDDNEAEDGDYAVEETPETDAPTGGVPTDAPEHSDTNNQVSGVQEGDVIKNDGRYIYHLSKDEHRVYIISATDGKTDIFGGTLEVMIQMLFHPVLDENGLLLSPHPYETPVCSFSYEYRNKLLAALGDGTLVLGAADKSGALITAKYAHKFQKPIFALPYAPGAAAGAGCNQLIKQGGFLTETAKDVADKFGNFYFISGMNVKKLSFEY